MSLEITIEAILISYNTEVEWLKQTGLDALYFYSFGLQ